MAGFLCKIVSSSEIPAKETHFAGYILFKQRLSFRSRELTMDADRGCTGDGGYLPSLFAAWFEAAHGTVKHHQVGYASGVAITIAIDMLKSTFLQLTDEVFIECNLEFRWDVYFVRLDHRHLNAGRLNFGGLISVAQRAASEE
jgi:hypothetical protein